MMKLLRPKYFLLGMLLGFVICCFIGHLVSSKARFQHFKRFFPAIQPQTQYYPTAHELLVTAEHELNPNKILVLIGGSSIFRGVGQNPEDLWSLELQKRLGDQYQVINFAMDSADLSSFAGVMFRVLKAKHKKTIFVSTCFPEGVGEIEGTYIFTYLFWDAFYKGLLIPNPKEMQSIRILRNKEILTAAGAEQHILAYLDSYFYFRNLWNWFSYKVFFTVWTDLKPRHNLRPRYQYKDSSNPNLQKQINSMLANQVLLQEAIDLFTQIISNNVNLSKEFPTVEETTIIRIRQSLDGVFTQDHRANILCVIPSENPYHLSNLPKNYQQAHRTLINKIRTIPESLGYSAIDVGQDFTPEDFFDARHFAATGGKKTAKKVEEKVKEMATLNHYL